MNFYIIPMCFISLFLLGLPLIIIDVEFERKARDKACEDLGTEKVYFNDGEYCMTDERLLKAAVFKCKGFLWTKECMVRFVKLEVN